MKSFQITISGDNFLFSRIINYNQVKKITHVILEENVISDEVPIIEKTTKGISQDDARLSLAEFLNQSQAKRIPDKIAAMAYYFREHQHQTDFSKDDLVAGFEAAMLPVPKNLNRDLRWAEKNGWLAEQINTGHFYLTSVGKQVVESKFPKAVTQKTTNQ